MWKNPQNTSWDIKSSSFGAQLGRNCQFSPKEDVLVSFTPVIYVYLLHHIMTQSLKNLYNGSWDMNFWPKKQFVEKFQLNDIYQITVPYHAAKFEKKNPSERYWDIETCIFWVTMKPKLPIWSETGILEKLKKKIDLVLVPCPPAKFGKKSLQQICKQRVAKFWATIRPNYPFGLKEGF